MAGGEEAGFPDCRQQGVGFMFPVGTGIVSKRHQRGEGIKNREPYKGNAENIVDVQLSLLLIHLKIRLQGRLVLLWLNC